MAAALLAAMSGPAAAGDPLTRARETAALGDPAKALSIAMDGLKAAPADRELFLYAVEMLPEAPTPHAGALAAAAAARVQKKDEHYAWYLGLCKALRISAKSQEALSNCKKALELEPTAYPVYRELGLTYAAAGNPRKAAETLEQGVEISSSDYKAHYNLGRVLELRGDGARAAQSYSRGLSLTIRAQTPDSQYYRALLKAGLRRSGKLKAKAQPKLKAPGKTAARKAADPRQAAACLAKFREEFLKDNLGSALETSDACVRLSPSDPELASERAPLMVRVGKYEEGVREYERAAVLYGPNNSMSAFCRVKAAETWLKLRETTKALAQYRLALAASPQDLNALKGLAELQENRSDSAGALTTYEAILKLDPGNARAGARRDELKTALLSDDQILAELHLRQAIDEQKTALLPEDSKLFKAIKAAELGGAVDYLKAKVPTARGMTVEKKTAAGTKILLTGAGYKAYVFHASKDAIKVFETSGVGLREIFQLRDLTGAPVFDPAGRLTPEGETVWRTGAGTQKTWLLPHEPVQESPKARETRQKIAALQGRGYEEISEPEYLWLLKVTRCLEMTLQNAPVSAIIQLDDGTRPRYMICYDEKADCSNLCNNKLPSYIASYRANNTTEIESDYSTGFFGRGAVKKRRFCENGEVWMGDIGITKDKNPCAAPLPSAR
ncbi:MAG: hypothetical protein A2X31_08635 [Elusimicrobia bacterium GWB2_63_22]|nr:MAG: hypothetical protein A2X31_08635 [Elusimicrobia bacterium GWB2_63_22]